jgi:hypothetical protein
MAVTHFQVLNRRPFAGGQSFGEAGPYERIDGVLRFAVDTANPLNGGIADLDLAPHDSTGRVHFEADLRLLRPLNPPAKGKLYCSVVNRGRAGIVPFSTPPKGWVPIYDDSLEAGDGFLLQRGYAVAFCGWQWDVIRRPGALGMEAPLAVEANGKPAETTVRVRFQPLTPRESEHLAHWPVHPSYAEDREHRAYPAADLQQRDAVLTVKDGPSDEAIPLPRSAWRFGRVVNGVETTEAEWATLDGGFEVGRIYELSYGTAQCPVAGLGLLAIRDAGAFLRDGSAEDGNPLAGTIAHTFVHGVSQCGRFLREFLQTGCNVDESGKRVFDGVFVQVAGARRGDFNVRGAQPSSQYGAGPAMDPPYSYVPTATCEATLLDVQRARGGVPLVFEVNTANEYWRSDAMLTHSDPATNKDLALPENVRSYLLAGCQHGPGVPFLTARAPLNPEQRVGNNLSILNQAPLLRTAMANLEAYVCEGIEPPPSAVPSLKEGTATTRESVLGCQRAIPGIDLPAAKHMKQTLVPAVDSDGNDLAGIRLPEYVAPLGTITGWNTRGPETGGAGQLADMMGSTLPFARDEAARTASHDPRPSLAERYRDAQEYQESVRAAAEAMVQERHMLAGDVERVVANAGVLWERVAGG